MVSGQQIIESEADLYRRRREYAENYQVPAWAQKLDRKLDKIIELLERTDTPKEQE